MGKLAELDTVKRLGEDVCRHIFSAAVVKGYHTVIVSFANEVITNGNVLRLRVECSIPYKLNSRLVVTVHGEGILEDKWGIEFG